MGIVLCERTNTCQSVKLTALLIAEHCSELRDAQRQVFVRTWLAGVNLTVVRAVHWLQHVLLVLFRCVNWLERVLAIVSIVTRGDIQVLRTDSRSDNLLIVVRLQYTTEQVLKAQTELCTLRQPDRQALTDTL